MVLWAGTSFYLINKIENTCANPITDICFHNGSAYAVSESSQGLVCHFVDADPASIPEFNGKVERIISGNVESEDTNHGRFDSQGLTDYFKQDKSVQKSLQLSPKPCFDHYSIKQIALPGGKI